MAVLSYIRSTLFLLGYSVSTVLYGTLCLSLFLLPPRRRHRIVVGWTYFIIWWARWSCGIKYRVVGEENLHKVERPCVVLSKHQCAWETFYLQTVFCPASTIVKKELLSIPFFGWGLAALRPIAIDRSNPREALKQVNNEGLQRLEDDVNLILFPEGTRVAPGEKGKYARSGTDIAVKSGKQILPVAHNAGKFWGNSKSFLKKPGLISVIIGEPIDTKNRSSKDLIKEIEEWIEAQQQLIDC